MHSNSKEKEAADQRKKVGNILNVILQAMDQYKGTLDKKM